MDAVERVDGLKPRGARFQQMLMDTLVDHRRYIERYGEDMPQIRNWNWQGRTKSE